MKWFGTDVWPAVGGYITLHSGSLIPQDVRREGMGIVLNYTAAAAWRAAGEVWNAVTVAPD